MTVAEPLHLKYGNGLQVTCYIFPQKKLLCHIFIDRKNLCCLTKSFVQVFSNCYKISDGLKKTSALLLQPSFSNAINVTE